MQLPILTPISTSRQIVDVFRGYNRNLRIGTGEFSGMQNLSSDHYPVLSPRRRRALYADLASAQGLIAKEQLCYVDGPDFILGEQRIPMDLSVDHKDCPKQLVSMGAYVLIFPDKKYINTAVPEDWGSMEARFVSVQPVEVSLCNAQGTVIQPDYKQNSVPQQPENGAIWMDTSATPAALKQWSEASGLWNPVLTTWVRVSHPGIGRQFSRYDGVTITGLSQISGLERMEAAVLQEVSEDFLVLSGLLAESVTVDTPVCVTRELPQMDFITESGNRLWGCRYGTDRSGEPVNRIYASKLGDFRNWNCFMGLSTDSYYASIGTDGPFTGAITHLGVPLFFKENCLHKVYGSVPQEFTVQDTACRGVQRGCEKSLAIVGECLYYKSRSGVCAYEGSLPREVSYALGEVVYHNAVAGSYGNKYYISMQSEDGWNLLVYDAAHGFWHREDDFHAAAFCSFGEDLYAIDADRHQIIAMLGTHGKPEENVNWHATTGELGLSDPEMQYISRITLRLQLKPGARMNVYAQYDQSEEWLHLASIGYTDLRSFSIPVRPRRSDFLRLKFVGEGEIRLYAMTKTIEKGSELSR